MEEREWFEVAIHNDLTKLRQNVRQFKGKQDNIDDQWSGHCLTETALMEAVACDKTEAVAFLSRFECGLTNQYKFTALMKAASHERKECVPYLLTEKTMQDDEGKTALHWACYRNNVECAKYLLSEVGFVDNDGKTPLQIAIERGSTECIQIIENYQKDKMFMVCDKSDWFIALRAGYLDSVKKYYKQFRNERTEKGESALQLAAYYNHKDCVEYLAQFELKLADQEGRTALMRAASRDCFECIPLLMSELKIQDKKGNCALHYACENDCPSASMLLIAEIDIKNRYGKTPLQIAAENNTDECNIVFEIQQRYVQNALTQDDWFACAKYGNLNAVYQVANQFKGKKSSNNQTALQIAVLNNQENIVKFLSQFECGLQDNEGKTALIHAAINNHFNLISYLQNEIGFQDKEGKSALIYASSNNHPEYISCLQKELKIQDMQGKTALIYACESNSFECVYHLSRYEFGLVDNDGMSALMHSVIKGNSHYIKYLQKELGIQDKEGNTALIYACQSNNISIVVQLLHEYYIQFIFGKTPFQVCEEIGYKECAKALKEYSKSKLLIVNSEDDWFTAATFGYINSIKQYSKKYKQQRNSKRETALMLAAAFQHIECIEYLAQFEIGFVDQDGKTALMHATENNSHLCITLLLKEMKEKDKNGMTALHHACSNNYYECAKLLLQEVDIQNNDGNTPIKIAQEKGATECVKLIENYVNTKQWFEAVEKENINFIMKAIDKYQKSQNYFGLTGLMISITHKNQKIVKFLCQYETGVTDDCGKTALIYASINNLPGYIPLLTNELKMKDKEGKTALFYACQNGFVECAKLLLQESGIPDNNMVTPLMLAKQQNNLQLVTLLQEYESKMFLQTVVENEQLNIQLEKEKQEKEQIRLENEKHKSEIEDLQKKIIEMQKMTILKDSQFVQVMKKGKGGQ